MGPPFAFSPAPTGPAAVRPWFVSGDAARRRSVAFLGAGSTQHLATHDGAPGSVMAWTWASLRWLPGWWWGMPLTLCLLWPGRRRRAVGPGYE